LNSDGPDWDSTVRILCPTASYLLPIVTISTIIVDRTHSSKAYLLVDCEGIATVYS
jgi:hypothetical protein